MPVKIPVGEGICECNLIQAFVIRLALHQLFRGLVSLDRWEPLVEGTHRSWLYRSSKIMNIPNMTTSLSPEPIPNDAWCYTLVSLSFAGFCYPCHSLVLLLVFFAGGLTYLLVLQIVSALTDIPYEAWSMRVLKRQVSVLGKQFSKVGPRVTAMSIARSLREFEFR